jgi:hypothetical protein
MRGELLPLNNEPVSSLFGDDEDPRGVAARCDLLLAVGAAWVSIPL